jgi:hypothetical protein
MAVDEQGSRGVEPQPRLSSPSSHTNSHSASQSPPPPAAPAPELPTRKIKVWFSTSLICNILNHISSPSSSNWRRKPHRRLRALVMIELWCLLPA